MSVIGDATAGLKAYLAEQFPDYAWDVGTRDGPVKDSKRGYVFGAGVTKSPTLRMDEVHLYVRMFIPKQSRSEVRNRNDATDPTELYDLVDALETALGERQAAQFGLWFYTLQTIEVDHISWGIEALLTGRVESPFVAALG